MTQPKKVKGYVAKPVPKGGLPAPLVPRAVVAKRIREVRGLRGWTALELAERCDGLGMPELNRSVIANIESGRRQDVSVTELLVFARALDVAPVNLLVPIDAADHDRYALTPNTPLQVDRAREWIRGHWADNSVNQRVYFSQLPEREFQPPEPPTDTAAVSQGESIDRHRELVGRLTPKTKGS